jgi:hypothetical protein
MLVLTDEFFIVVFFQIWFNRVVCNLGGER